MAHSGLRLPLTASLICFASLLTAAPWDEVIATVSDRATLYIAEAEQRGFTEIAERHADDGWRQAFREDHRCAILGRMLGMPDVIAEIEQMVEPKIHEDMSGWEILQLYGVGRSYQAWVVQAKAYQTIDVTEKAGIWNQECRGSTNLERAPRIIVGTSLRFADAQVDSNFPDELSPVMPDFDGRDNWARSFRTRIREGLAERPNFAGHYSVIMFGCGGSCRGYFVADSRTGEVFGTPFGGEASPEISVSFEVDSRVLYAYQMGETSDKCALYTWSFDRGDFSLEGEDFYERTVSGCNNGLYKVITAAR